MKIFDIVLNPTLVLKVRRRVGVISVQGGDPPLHRDSCWIYTLSDDERSNRMLPPGSGDLWVVSHPSILVVASFRRLGDVRVHHAGHPNCNFWEGL